MKDLKISFVKFYQGVMIHNNSMQTSSKVVSDRTANNLNLVSIEKSPNGVLITTTDVSNRKSFTEVPYNNVAYINYEVEEAQAPVSAPETKATKTSKA